MRRPNRVEMGLERMSVARTVQAVERCHVAALLMDGAEGPTDQDKKLCGLAIERGRAVVLVVNKWDLVKGDRSGDAYAKKLAEEFAFAPYLPHLYTTALSGRNVQKFLPIVNRLHANLFRRIPTHQLNTFYREVLQTHPPMPGGSGSVRIRFLTQVQVDPPTILAFAGGRGEVPQNYIRFVQRELRARYDFEGVPLRIISRRK
jgi:GTP-binding protein